MGVLLCGAVGCECAAGDAHFGACDDGGVAAGGGGGGGSLVGQLLAAAGVVADIVFGRARSVSALLGAVGRWAAHGEFLEGAN